MRTITRTTIFPIRRKAMVKTCQARTSRTSIRVHLQALFEVLDGLGRDTKLTANSDCSELATLDQSAHGAGADRPPSGQRVDGPVGACNPIVVSRRSAATPGERLVGHRPPPGRLPGRQPLRGSAAVGRTSRNATSVSTRHGAAGFPRRAERLCPHSAWRWAPVSRSGQEGGVVRIQVSASCRGFWTRVTDPAGKNPLTASAAWPEALSRGRRHRLAWLPSTVAVTVQPFQRQASRTRGARRRQTAFGHSGQAALQAS